MQLSPDAPMPATSHAPVSRTVREAFSRLLADAVWSIEHPHQGHAERHVGTPDRREPRYAAIVALVRAEVAAERKAAVPTAGADLSKLPAHERVRAILCDLVNAAASDRLRDPVALADAVAECETRIGDAVAPELHTAIEDEMRRVARDARAECIATAKAVADELRKQAEQTSDAGHPHDSMEFAVQAEGARMVAEELARTVAR